MVLGPILSQGLDQGSPTPSPAPTNPVRPSGNIGTRWSDWISDPANRAGMIQAGLSMLQPVSPGQTVGGHIASGVGQGFAARDRNVASREKQALAQRAMAVDERKADAALTRANAATAAYDQLKTSQIMPHWLRKLNEEVDSYLENNFNLMQMSMEQVQELRRQAFKTMDLTRLWDEFRQSIGPLAQGLPNTPPSLSQSMQSPQGGGPLDLQTLVPELFNG